MTNRCPRCSAILVAGFGCVAHGEPPVVLDDDVVAELTGERAKRPAAVRWTQEQWEEAEAVMAIQSGPQIAEHLSARFGVTRSWKSVKHQFERRGISKPPVRSGKRAPKPRPHWANREPGSRWVDEEIEALEDGELRILVRARSPHAMACKASRMGQPIRSGDGAMSVRQVSERWRIRHASVIEWISRGLLPAVRSGRMWRIDPGDAERTIPYLRRQARANNGRKRWWEE